MSYQVLMARLALFLLFPLFANAQTGWYGKRMHQFVAYDKIPTWMCMLSDFKGAGKLHIIDHSKNKGHADFVSNQLKRGTTFAQFKGLTKSFKTREYVPFFIYDLRDMPIEVGGKKHKWAIRLVDYGYEDNEAEMAKTTLKTLDAVKKEVLAQSGDAGNGLILLATSPSSKPNTSVATSIKQAGYSHLTLSQMLAATKATTTKVLNEGVAVGYIKLVKTGKGQTTSISQKDIAIFESLPDRVPIANGIITLEAQTPLSHVNLLAKNRKTVNLYLNSLDDLPNLRKSIGKLVKLECKGQTAKITPIALKDAEAFWAKQKMPQVEIVVPDKTLRYISYFEKGSQSVQKTEYIGSKAANYALIQRELPEWVRPGFAIPFAFYFDMLESKGASKEVALFLSSYKSMDANTRGIGLKKIRHAIKGSQISPDLLNQLKVLIENEFPKSRIRLRSSTNCEDLAEFNGAGLYTSKGFDTWLPIDSLSKKLLTVYASLWSERAFEEREFYSIDHRKAAMAILINEAYHKEWANGVAITSIEENGQISLYINSQIEDKLVTNPSQGELPEALFFSSIEKPSFVVESFSPLGKLMTKDAEGNPNLESLRLAMLKIHQLLASHKNKKGGKYGVDVEFKLVKDGGGAIRLYIKQARLLGGTAAG